MKDLAKEIANILISDQVIGKQFKIITHPFDPTEETVRSTQIINIEYNGENVEFSTNKSVGGIQRYICKENYDVNMYLKTSRNLNSSVMIPYIERVISVLSNAVLDEEEISNKFLTFQGVEKIERKDAFYQYKIKFSAKRVR